MGLTRASHARAVPPATRQRGLTLLELLTVLTILTAIFALSAGVYRTLGRSHALPAAASQVSSVIRAARNFSLSSGLPSRVFLEPEADRVSAFGFELIASWHLEDARELAMIGERIPPGSELSGAFGERALVVGEVSVTRGRVGAGLEFANDGAALVARHRPALYSPHGFSLEAWVSFWPPPPPKASNRGKKGAWHDPRREERFAVIAKHDSYEMGLLGDGAVYVLLGRLDGDDSYTAVTRGDEVVAARWSHLRVTYDGVSLAVEVDGIEREWFPDGFHLIDPDDWPPFPDVVPASDGDLTVSHQLRFFMGLIDEPKVRVALEPRSYSLPSGIELLGRERTIRFDSRGSLDPLYHSRPVVVRVADLPDEEDPGEPRKGTTAVAPRPPPGPRGGAAGAESLDPGDVGDPMRALARYVAENTERGSLDGDPQGVGGIGDGSPGGAGAPLSPGVEGDLERGRVQTIIVDLTGTIRG